MGCQLIRQIDNLDVKSESLRLFFINCQKQGFYECYIRKRTLYEYRYLRNLREWQLIYEKDLFQTNSPVYLSPCQPEKFLQLLEGIVSFENNSEKFSLNGFPSNIGMLLIKGSQFPTFTTHLLGLNDQSTFQIQGPTIFVHWKIEQQLAMSIVNQHMSRTVGLFQKQSNASLESAFERAQAARNYISQVRIIGICTDQEIKKSNYENYLKQKGYNLDEHIWIPRQVSMYSKDIRDENPYENEAFQVFRFAQNDSDSEIKGLYESVYLVSENGIFLGVFKENFADVNFCQQIARVFQDYKPLSTEEEIQMSLSRTEHFKNQFSDTSSIRRDDYQRLKKLIKDEIAYKTKDSDKQLIIGDTFRLVIEKQTFFANYKKFGAKYLQPTLWASASPKYTNNFNQLIKWLKNQISLIQVNQDYKRRNTIDKITFFQYLSKKMMDNKWTDVRYILERQQSIYFSKEAGKFVMERKIESIHNAPISVGSVFSRKNQMTQIYQEITKNQDQFDHSCLPLLRDFFGNLYGFQTSFEIGQFYCPIPNLYRINYMDQTEQIINELNLDYSQFKENISAQQNIETDINQFDSIQADLSYDLENALIQKNNEIMIIYLIDFGSQEQLKELNQILQLSSGKCRIVTISQVADDKFENAFIKYKFETPLRQGVFEPWFFLEQKYLGINFNKLLEDLYGLNNKKGQNTIVIDDHKKLAFRGKIDMQFAYSLNGILNKNQSSAMNEIDTQLKQRIKSAVFEKEWNKMKSYGYIDMKNNQIIKIIEAYLQLNQPKENEFWRFEMNSFQVFLTFFKLSKLWTQKGKLLAKFYEKPRICFRFERSELIAKFEHIQKEIQSKFGSDKIEISNLNENNAIVTSIFMNK